MSIYILLLCSSEIVFTLLHNEAISDPFVLPLALFSHRTHSAQFFSLLSMNCSARSFVVRSKNAVHRLFAVIRIRRATEHLFNLPPSLLYISDIIYINVI